MLQKIVSAGIRLPSFWAGSDGLRVLAGLNVSENCVILGSTPISETRGTWNMNGLIRASLKNPYAVTVMCLTLVLLGVVSARSIPVDILPVFNSPAVQVLTFYSGMPAASVEKDITNRMERWVGQAAGTLRQESRSIVGASIVRNYFRSGVDPNGALTQVNSLALAAIPNLPPGTLPPVVLPFDPTSSTPVCIVALDSKTQSESILYDVGRYEVRNMIMAINGAVAPVVYGGKIRAVMAYLDRQKMQARGLSPVDVMNAIDNYNLFLPTGDAKFGTMDYALDSNSMYDAGATRWATSRCGRSWATRRSCGTWRRRRTPASSRRTSCGSTAGDRSTSRCSASSGPARWRWSGRSSRRSAT